jgi:hypothetical protein
MLPCLPAYKHDYSRYTAPFTEDGVTRATRHSGNKICSTIKSLPVQEFSTTALHQAVVAKTPALFTIKNFDPQGMLNGLHRFASQDQHTFYTSNGAHVSDGLKLRMVFDLGTRETCTGSRMGSTKRKLHQLSTPPTFSTCRLPPLDSIVGDQDIHRLTLLHGRARSRNQVLHHRHGQLQRCQRYSPHRRCHDRQHRYACPLSL